MDSATGGSPTSATAIGHQSDTERFSGYRRALEEAGLPFEPELVVHGDGKPEGAGPAMARLLDLPKRPTAVFCYNDMSALGAMREYSPAACASRRTFPSWASTIYTSATT